MTQQYNYCGCRGAIRSLFLKVIESLKGLIKQPACYKNPARPTCIDLIITNIPHSFQSTCLTETGLLVFYLMTLTVVEKAFNKKF